MMDQALAAWLHFAAIFIALTALVAELVLLRRELDAPAARLLARIDGVYGAGAGLIIATGLARVFWYGKGPGYYAGNPIFWAKMAVVAAIALLSLVPTVQFMRWRRAIAAGEGVRLTEPAYRRLRGALWVQAALFLVLPLLAALMARGFGG